MGDLSDNNNDFTIDSPSWNDGYFSLSSSASENITRSGVLGEVTAVFF